MHNVLFVVHRGHHTICLLRCSLRIQLRDSKEDPSDRDGQYYQIVACEGSQASAL